MSSSKSSAPAPGAEAGKAPRSAEKTRPMDLGLTERRRTVRPLPVPDAVESNRDTDWAPFQALSTDSSDET